MSTRGLDPQIHGPVDLAEAIRILTTESRIDRDDETPAEIANLVGCESAALRWAGSLARTTGWRPLRQRLASWALLPGLLRDARLPWHADVERALGALPPTEAKLAATLAACDSPFAWDVLDTIEPTVAIESICLLEDAGLLTRRTHAGVVSFTVPYCVRAFHRLINGAAAEQCAVRWLEAWVRRAEELRPASYGVSSQATLSELVCAVPLAERALFDAAKATQELGLALWTRASDAMFFAKAIDFASPAFARAVAIADAAAGPDPLEPRVRARIAASRASLERGNPTAAKTSCDEAVALAEAAGRDDLRSEALRGSGWAELASAQLEAARSSFVAAQRLSEGASDPRGQADAAAGLGVHALLSGDPERARALLSDALATHVVTRDAPREATVRGMMALLPDEQGPTPDVATLTTQVEELRTSGQRWREALMLARLGLAARARGDSDGERAHLVEARAAAALASMSASKLVASLVDARSSPGPGIVVGFEGRSLQLPSGESHDLTRHGPVRRMLWALAVAKADKPGVALSTLELVAVGWPGEKMKHEAATLRVYTTIRRLRALGLANALVTRDDGYLFDPEISIVQLTADS